MDAEEKRTRTNKGSFLAIAGIFLLVFGVFLGLISKNPPTNTSLEVASSIQDNLFDRKNNNGTLMAVMPKTMQLVENFCSVCGEGQEVGNPNAIFAFPGQPAKSCGDIEDEGEAGEIPLDQCDIFPDLISDLCDCREIREKCSVCGEGLEVGNPDAIFAFPSQPTTSCGDLEQEGDTGNISLDQCDILPDLISGLCECRPIGSGPTVAPTIANEPCSVCGEGEKVGNPDAIFSFPSIPPIACGDLENDGESGRIDAEQCNLLPLLIGSLCECESSQPVEPTPPPSTQSPRTPPPSTQSPRTPPPSTQSPRTPPPSAPSPLTPPPSAPGPLTPPPSAQSPTDLPVPDPTPQTPPTEDPSNDTPSSNPSSDPPSTSPTSLSYEYNLSELLPFLEEYANKEFYMVEILYYNDRVGDLPYIDLLNNDIFPSIGAEVVANGTILLQKDFTVVKYPNGTVFRQGILQNQKVQDALVHRRASVYECQAWATTLVPKALVPNGLTVAPLPEESVPFPPPPGTPMTLFFHAICFSNVADYSSYPNVPVDERQTTGREAVAKFDELATPLKANENGMRAVAWLDVKVMAIGTQDMNQVRIETIPTLVGLGEAMQTDTWIMAQSHRESGVTDSTVTTFANATTDISQYYYDSSSATSSSSSLSVRTTLPVFPQDDSISRIEGITTAATTASNPDDNAIRRFLGNLRHAP